VNDLPTLLNDLKDCFSSLTIKLFADDVKANSQTDCIQGSTNLQNYLDEIYEWCTDSQLFLNTDKCLVLHVGKKNQHITYKISNKTLPAVTEVNDLGILVDHRLSYQPHIVAVMMKARQRCALFFK